MDEWHQQVWSLLDDALLYQVKHYIPFDVREAGRSIVPQQHHFHLN
jgi:hypothetical protein